jgi:hypothetical protein
VADGRLLSWQTQMVSIHAFSLALMSRRQWQSCPVNLDLRHDAAKTPYAVCVYQSAVSGPIWYTLFGILCRHAVSRKQKQSLCVASQQILIVIRRPSRMRALTQTLWSWVRNVDGRPDRPLSDTCSSRFKPFCPFANLSLTQYSQHYHIVLTFFCGYYQVWPLLHK